jgi:hypothetical protein
MGVDRVDSSSRMKARRKMMESGVAGRSIIAVYTPTSRRPTRWGEMGSKRMWAWRVLIMEISRRWRKMVLADGTASAEEGQAASRRGDDRTAMWAHVDVLSPRISLGCDSRCRGITATHRAWRRWRFRKAGRRTHQPTPLRGCSSLRGDWNQCRCGQE